jgi:hypothetical protein
MLLGIYVFKFQRMTLGIVRRQRARGIDVYQELLTPNWMGSLGLIYTLFTTGLIIWTFTSFNWGFFFSFWILTWMVKSLIQFLVPVPTAQHYLKIMDQCLTDDMFKDVSLISTRILLQEEIKSYR